MIKKKQGKVLPYDERILGSSDFVEQVRKETGEKVGQLFKNEQSLEPLIKKIIRKHKVTQEMLRSNTTWKKVFSVALALSMLSRALKLSGEMLSTSNASSSSVT